MSVCLEVALSNSSCVVICLPPTRLPFASFSPDTMLVLLGAVSTGQRQFGHLSQTTGQSRGSRVDYLPDAQNSVTDDYCVCAWHTLDLLLSCRGVALGTQCKLSESTATQACCTHRACTCGEPGTTSTPQSLHRHSTVCVRAGG